MIEDWMPVELAITLLLPEEFYQLVFIENDETRRVTGEGRGLGVVAGLILKVGIDQVFTSSPWFERVGTIFEHFNRDEFSSLLLTPSKANERSESRGGDWYLEDGNHRALALALLMKLGKPRIDVPAVIVFRLDDVEDADPARRSRSSRSSR